jgi:hypothetical protein
MSPDPVRTHQGFQILDFYNVLDSSRFSEMSSSVVDFVSFRFYFDSHFIGTRKKILCFSPNYKCRNQRDFLVVKVH